MWCQTGDKPSQIAKFMGPTWGPSGSCRPQMGPMSAPWTLLSGITGINDDPICWHHNDVMPRKLFPHYCPFIRRIHWSLVDPHYKGLVTRTLMFSLMLAWTSGWINHWVTGDLRSHDAHRDINHCNVLYLCVARSCYHIVQQWCNHVSLIYFLPLLTLKQLDHFYPSAFWHGGVLSYGSVQVS